jgi:16S rRNA processing protein RimM
MSAAIVSKSRSWTEDFPCALRGFRAIDRCWQVGGINAVTDYRRIAQISRVKGLAGQLVALPVIDLPLGVWEGLCLWVVPPEHDLVRKTRVLSVAACGSGLLLSLEGVADRATAQRLQGRHLLARAEDCGDGADQAGDVGDADDSRPAFGHGKSALGLKVSDEREGFLGTIVEERIGFAQTLWVVDGPFGEVLIPAVDEFIGACDKETIRVLLPPGLLELNR